MEQVEAIRSLFRFRSVCVGVHTGDFTMTIKKTRPDKDDKSAAEKRVAEIVRLYERIRDMLDAALTQFGTPDSMTPKAVMSKLAELQSVHLTILKAEEAFHEKCKTTDGQPDIDFDAVRDDIGRQLDRLRCALEAEEVSKKA